MNPSPQTAVQALAQLAQEAGAGFEMDGSTATLRIAGGGAATGLTGATAVRAAIAVSLGGDGRYTVGVRQAEAHGGIAPSGVSGSGSWSSSAGTVRSKRIEKGIGPNGAYDLGYDTTPWTDAIDQRLSALGWTRASAGALVATVLWFVVGGLLLAGALALGIVGAVLSSALLLGLLAVPLLLGVVAVVMGSRSLRRR